MEQLRKDILRAQFDSRRNNWKFVKKTFTGSGGWASTGVNTYESREAAEAAIDQLISIHPDLFEKEVKCKLLALTDKNGTPLPVNSIIYGSLPNETEKHYFNIGYGSNGSIEMIACTYGYVHSVEQSHLAGFEYIGLAKDNLHLLECD